MGACQSQKSKQKKSDEELSFPSWPVKQDGEKWWAIEREAETLLASNPRAAISKFEAGLEMKSKDPVANQLGIAKSYICMGMAASAAKLPPAKIVEYVEKALPTLETHDKTLRVLTLNLLASATAQANDYNEGSKWAKECLEYATANFGENSKEVLCGIVSNGFVAKCAKKPDEAISWFEKAIPISTKQPALDSKGIVLHMMGGMMGSEDPLDGLLYTIRASSSPDLPMLYFYMAETMLEAGKNDKGFEYLAKEMDAARSLGTTCTQTHKVVLNTTAAKYPIIEAKIRKIANK